MRFTEESVSIPNQAENSVDSVAPIRRRMSTGERKRQILDQERTYLLVSFQHQILHLVGTYYFQ